MARAPVAAEIEELPEPDRVEGFPHPRTTANLFGQDAAERTLLKAFESGRMHHGWLIAGPEGIGKATLAYRFAKFLLAAVHDRDAFGGTLAVAADVPAARQVIAQAHPGLLVLRRPYDFKTKKLKTEITVDEARRLAGFLHLTPDQDAWRVVIVDTADELSISAANALLKSLEEPPPQTVFVLLTSYPGRLLPTIRSRCRLLELPALAPDALRKAVTQAIAASGEESTASLPAASDWDELLQLADGSVRRLLALHAGSGLELNRRLVAVVRSLPMLDWVEVHRLADDLSSPAADARFELFFGLLSGLVARLIRARAGAGGASGEAELAARLIGDGRLTAWAEAFEAMHADKATADALNLDRKSLILGLFSRLAALSRG